MKIEICGYDVLIDDEDYVRIRAINWRRTSAGLYFGTGRKINGKYKIIFFHRFIIDAPEGFEVDHINMNTLDNRKINLRICTKAQNRQNRSMYKNNPSGYKGVTFNKSKNKWMGRISENKKYHFLGYFDTPEEAYEAYCKASKKYHKEYGRIA